MSRMFLLFLLASCTASDHRSHRRLFDSFHSSFEKSDFEEIKTILTDDFQFTSFNGDIYPKQDYVNYLQDWNKTFDTKWNIVSVTDLRDTLVSIEYDTDIFNDWLYNGKRRFRYIYYFREGKICGLRNETVAENTAEGGKSEERFSKFRRWVGDTHPSMARYCTENDKYAAVRVKGLLREYLYLLSGNSCIPAAPADGRN